MIGSVEALFEQFVFDPSIIDLVVWFPHLSWGDFGVACAIVVTWRVVTNRIESFVAMGRLSE